MNHQLTEEERALEPVISWHNEPDRGYTVLKICTWDRLGLFSKLCGSISAAGINILGSQSFTRSDGIALDTFYVTDALGGTMVTREERERFEEIVNKAFTGQQLNFAALIARQRQARPLYQSHEGERIQTCIRIDNEGSQTSTIIEVETEDRLGLLYTISQVFFELGVDIIVAKIVTEKGAAIDTFYVESEGSGKISNPEDLQHLQQRLHDAISALDAPMAGARAA